MKLNRRGRLPKQRRSMSSKDKEDNAGTRIRYTKGELVRNVGMIMDFIGVRKTLFNH